MNAGLRLDVMESGQFDTLIEVQDCHENARLDCEGTEIELLETHHVQRDALDAEANHLDTEHSQMMFEQKSLRNEFEDDQSETE